MTRRLFTPLILTPCTLSVSPPRKREVLLFEKVPIQVVFQMLTGGQGTPPSPLFDGNHRNTGGVFFYSLLISFCPCLLSVEGIMRLPKPSRGMILSQGSLGGQWRIQWSQTASQLFQAGPRPAVFSQRCFLSFGLFDAKITSVMIGS